MLMGTSDGDGWQHPYVTLWRSCLPGARPPRSIDNHCGAQGNRRWCSVWKLGLTRERIFKRLHSIPAVWVNARAFHALFANCSTLRLNSWNMKEHPHKKIPLNVEEYCFFVFTLKGTYVGKFFLFNCVALKCIEHLKLLSTVWQKCS